MEVGRVFGRQCLECGWTFTLSGPKASIKVVLVKVSRRRVSSQELFTFEPLLLR